MMSDNPEDYELFHYGVKGMKWGERRKAKAGHEVRTERAIKEYSKSQSELSKTYSAERKKQRKAGKGFFEAGREADKTSHVKEAYDKYKEAKSHAANLAKDKARRRQAPDHNTKANLDVKLTREEKVTRAYNTAKSSYKTGAVLYKGAKITGMTLATAGPIAAAILANGAEVKAGRDLFSDTHGIDASNVVNLYFNAKTGLYE